MREELICQLIQQLLVAETIQGVVIHHADGLHKSVADRRPHKFEPAALQLTAHRKRFRALGGDLGNMFPAVFDASVIDESPDKTVETAVFCLDFEKAPGIVNSGHQFQLVANYAFVRQQGPHFLFSIAGDFARVKPVECAAVSLPFSEDGYPAQTRLGAFQNEKFEQFPVIV